MVVMHRPTIPCRRPAGMSLTEILLSLVLIGVLAAFFVPKVLRATNDLFDAEYYVTGQKIAEFLNDAREHYGLLRQSMGPQRMSTSLGQVEGITERFDVLTGDHLNSSPMPPAAGEILYAGNASAGITPGRSMAAGALPRAMPR
ncbi:MAG: type II secretion system protein [Vampirovibrionales bacterium]